MNELRDLYQELVLEHARSPRNFRALEGPGARKAEGYNPLCGDHFTVFVQMDGECLKDVSFQGAGCAISTASASVMTETVKGRTAQDVSALFECFHALVTGRMGMPPAGEGLGKLAAFSGVSDYPARVKCASLAWHALKGALAGQDEVMVSTE